MPVAPPSVAVTAAAAERLLLEADSLYHAGGVYYASHDDAALARRRKADQLAARARRHRVFLNTHPCRWCGEVVTAGESYDLVAGEPVHTSGCMGELDALMYPGADDREGR